MDVIRFGTAGWRATLDEFTVPRVRKVAQAVATYLDDEGIEGAVAVGYDARETSRGFAEEVSRVLCANGRDVLMPARDRPTPLIAWAVVERELAGAVVITASHNPPEYNGVKFLSADGASALPRVMDAVKARIAEPTSLPEGERGTVREVDVVEPHARHAFDLVDPPDLGHLTVVYDAMHGSGRGVTDALLEDAGATVRRLRCDRDPTFGGTPPEPSEERLGALIDAVDAGADLGIANDGDADRIAVVTPDRGYIGGNLLYAVLYDYLLEDDAGPAVRTVATTFLIDQIAADHGQEVFETPVGFKWVGKAMDEHDALIGGEESDGLTVRGHVRQKDGVLMALYAAAATAERPLDDRLDEIETAYGEVHGDKTSVDCPDGEKDRVLEGVEAALPDTIAGVDVEEVNRIDGVKILLEDGSWVLIRPSGTEPKMRVYAEAQSDDRVRTLLDAGSDQIERVLDGR